MTKYGPLTDWLRRFDGDHVTLSFAQVAEILGQGLPASSFTHAARWRSTGPGRP